MNGSMKGVLAIIICFGTLACVLAWVIIPDINSFQTITVKDKCASENGYDYYVFGNDDTKYIVGGEAWTDSAGLYSKMQIGGTYQVKILKRRFSPPHIISVITMDEYAQTCEARGLC